MRLQNTRFEADNVSSGNPCSSSGGGVDLDCFLLWSLRCASVYLNGEVAVPYYTVNNDDAFLTSHMCLHFPAIW